MTIPAPDFIPLGSVCTVEGVEKRLMVISRGMVVEQGGASRYYDYGACLYPEGLLGDEVAYFNHGALTSVVWEGLTDEEDRRYTRLLADGVEALDVEQGDPAPFAAPPAAEEDAL